MPRHTDGKTDGGLTIMAKTADDAAVAGIMSTVDTADDDKSVTPCLRARVDAKSAVENKASEEPAIEALADTDQGRG
jgi:hypothetical protein